MSTTGSAAHDQPVCKMDPPLILSEKSCDKTSYLLKIFTVGKLWTQNLLSAPEAQNLLSAPEAQNLLSAQALKIGTSMEFILSKCLLVCSNQLLDQNEHNWVMQNI